MISLYFSTFFFRFVSSSIVVSCYLPKRCLAEIVYFYSFVKIVRVAHLPQRDAGQCAQVKLFTKKIGDRRGISRIDQRKTKSKRMEKYKYGLCLSGGGVRGLAHVGVIQAMQERGMEASVVSGTSAGAIVGALYAQGMTPDEMLDFFYHTEIFRWSNYTWFKPGLIDTDKFYGIFKKHMPEDDFESLSKELFVVTTDILHGKPRVFSEGPLIKPVLASAAFPVVLSPVEIEGVLYSDGGIVNNFPIELIRDKCK